MRAVQVVARGKAEFIEAPEPALKPGHALVRTLLLSLCGSDLQLLHYLPPDSYPLPVGSVGHEMVGIVEAVNDATSGIKEGDVALTLAPSAQAMAEYFVAPLEDVLVLPSGCPIEHLLMAQQLGTVIFACKRLPNIMGKDVVVIGQGSAGLFFDAILRRMGAERVVGLDVKEARVAAALKFGATHAFNNAEADPLAVIEEITDGKLADLVIEAAGEVDTINLTPALVKIGGQLLFFGVPHEVKFGFDHNTWFRKYCYTTSSGEPMLRDAGRKSFRKALELIEGGEIDVSPMPTHRFSFEQVLEAYELAKSRADGVIKVVIEMPGYQPF